MSLWEFTGDLLEQLGLTDCERCGGVVMQRDGQWPPRDSEGCMQCWACADGRPEERIDARDHVSPKPLRGGSGTSPGDEPAGRKRPLDDGRTCPECGEPRPKNCSRCPHCARRQARKKARERQRRKREKKRQQVSRFC